MGDLMKEDNMTKKQLIDELTELRSQNAALKKSESTEKYRILVENIRDVIYELDSQGVVLYISPTIRNLLGYDSAEIVGKNFIELAHKDDLSSLAEWFSELRKGKEYPSEYRVSNKSGEIKWVRTKTRPLMEDGLFKGARGILIDVTAQRRVEEALRKSEEYFKAIIQNSSDIILIVDKLGAITYASPSIGRFLGYRPDELIGKRSLDLIVSDDKPKAIADFGRALLTKEVSIPNVFRIRHKDGTERILEGIGKNLLDNPIVAGFVMNVRDITERKQAENALRDSEKRYRELSDFLPISFFEVDAAGSIISFNHTALEVFRYNEKDYKEGMNALQFFAPEEWQRVGEKMGKVIQGTSTPGQEFTFLRKDGSKFIGLIYASPNIHQNKTVGIRGAIIDITERKRNEEQIHRQSKLLAAINRVFFETLTADSEETVANTCLKVAQEITDSKFGFIGEITPAGLFTTTALSNPGWEACRIPETQANVLIKDMVIRGIWGQVILKKQSLIVNDPVSYPDRVGIPEGHPPLTSFLGVPLKDQSKVIGMIAMANCGSGYTADHQQDMESLSVAFVEAIRRKQVEAALRESEEKYRELVKNAPAGIYEVDYETNRFTSVNDVICEYTGYTRDEMLTMNLFNLLTEESQKLMLTRFEMLMAGEKIPQTVEYCIRTRGGEELWVLLNARYIYETGKLKGATGVIYNITDRRKAEEALRESEELLRSYLENAPDGIYMNDLESNFLYGNRKCEEITGYRREELIGKNFLELNLLSENSLNKAVQLLQANMEGRSTGPDEIDLISKEGRLIPVEINTNVVQRLGQRIVLSFVRDITERKKAEDSLKETLASLRKAFGTIIQVMVSAVESRDPYTAGHQIRSTNLARYIATEMGLSQDTIEAIRMAGPIHDIGKLSIPAEILSKPTKLTNIEFSLIKEHSKQGYEMLKDVESPWPLAQIVYQHHERMDGSGYPRNLKGEEILMEARILAVADVVEAMASHRPYRPAIGLNAALAEIENNKGTLYDVDAVDVCLKLFREQGFQLEGTSF
jgi:PAS domain S-box-containing protein